MENYNLNLTVSELRLLARALVKHHQQVTDYKEKDKIEKLHSKLTRPLSENTPQQKKTS